MKQSNYTDDVRKARFLVLLWLRSVLEDVEGNRINGVSLDAVQLPFFRDRA
jgi:hypothetical protein